MPAEYRKVVAAAIKDVVTNGYDSPERIAFWVERIRSAANVELGSPDVAERKLREALTMKFTQLVDKAVALQRHRGVSRFALERARPSLRAELTRRALAGTSLVRLNRTEAIDKIVHRFIGWSTSVPSGGTRSAPADLKQLLADLPYEDRRLTADQTHKLTSNISDLIADSGDAIGGFWCSNYRQPGYKYRVQHKHRDGEFHLRRDSWALIEGLVKKNGVEFTDEIEAPGEWPYCRCWYKYIYNLDEVPVEFITARGKKALSVRAIGA